MAKKKASAPDRTNDEIRTIMLRYFYDRNSSATSARGKRGFAAKISDIKRELKDSHALKQNEIVGNLNYLLSQGWVAEDTVEKSVPLKTGTVIPQSTSYYKITADGIDKIEGEGEFTMDKFRGIRIEATGQNIITVGDGNQVDAKYGALGSELSDLKDAVRESDDMTESEKINAIADIDTIQNQLAKSTPNKSIVGAAWASVEKLGQLASLTANVGTAAGRIAEIL